MVRRVSTRQLDLHGLNVYNEYEAAAASSGTDWVVNFPTKRFYVDTFYVGTVSPNSPFEEFFDSQNEDGLSCTESASRSMTVKKIRSALGLRILSVSSGPAGFLALPRDERDHVQCLRVRRASLARP